MENIHLTVLLVYATSLMCIGLWVGRRRVRVASDFFVAGRQLGSPLLFSTMLAANIGAGSTIAAAGLGYANGLSAWWWVGSAGIGSMVLAFWVGPLMRRLSSKHQFRTLGDYLEYRYGAGIRTTITLLMCCGTLALLAVQLIGIGWVLNVITGIERWLGSVIGGVVVIVYFTAGGLLTSAWINMLQLAVLLIGFGAALPFALDAAGTWSHVYDATLPIEDYWNVWQNGESGWFYLIVPGLAFIVSPGLIQKVYGAKDDKTVRVAVAANGIVLLLFAAVPPVFGMIARSLHPTLSDTALALPTILVEHVPPAIGALGLAALFSAEVSSADAILFMLSTSLSRDLYQRFFNPNTDGRHTLLVARGAAIAGGILGTGIAVVAVSLEAVLMIFYSLLVVSVFVPLLGGLYTKKLTAPEAYGAIFGGVGCFLVAEIGYNGVAILGMTPSIIGLLGATFGCLSIVVIRTLNQRTS